MNKNLVLILALALSGCYSPPQIYKPDGLFTVKNSINKLIDESRLETNIGIKAINLSSGETIFELNGKSLFNPASNNKLYTSLSAIAILDTSYVFRTSIYRDGNKIFLVGGGDPDLSLNELDSLANIVAIKHPSINEIILDDTIMDSLTYGPGWMWDEGDEWYSAQISALSVNDNCIDFIINPSTNGNLINIETYPYSSYYTFLNQAYTVNDTVDFEKLKITRDWKNNRNSFLITGSVMDTSSADTIIRNVDEPTDYAGHLFREMLIKKGLNIKKLDKGIYSNSGTEIATHYSKSLPSILENLMVESDNLTAELLVKIIGYEYSQIEGNWQNGLHAMKVFLHDKASLDTTSFSISDGSGVSRYNYSSANNFISLLSWAYHNPEIRNNLLNILSFTGEKGTLLDRGLPNGVYAKTGSLSGVSTFSGYILNPDKDPIAFSILMNGYKGSSLPFRELQDKIVSHLAEIK